MSNFRNLCVNWHAERKLYAQINLYAVANRMEEWNVTGFLNMEVSWPGKLNIFVNILPLQT